MKTAYEYTWSIDKTRFVDPDGWTDGPHAWVYADRQSVEPKGGFDGHRDTDDVVAIQTAMNAAREGAEYHGVSDLSSWEPVPDSPGVWEAQGSFADDTDVGSGTPAIADVRLTVTRREPVELPYSEKS